MKDKLNQQLTKKELIKDSNEVNNELENQNWAKRKKEYKNIEKIIDK